MHKIAIPEYARQLVADRGGGTRILKAIVPARSALLVIDMQNAFVMPGAPLEVPYAREIVPTINRLATAFRRTGARIVWIQTSFRDQADSWSAYFSQRLRPDLSARVISALTPGALGYDLFSGLAAQPDDIQVVKTRFSAFIQGASDLDAMLRKLGIDTLFITGTVSNTCCEATARDAMMLNYKVVFLSDANATRTDEEHNATLANMLQAFADVASADEVAEAIRAAEPIR